MNRRFTNLIAFVSLSLWAWLTPVPATASVGRVWAVNDGEKVERDDLKNPNKASNSAWDGRKIKLFGARNEIIAFQVIVEADRQGIERLTLALRELTLKGGRAK